MSSKFNHYTGASLIFLGIYLNIPFSILGAVFDYPNILRRPTGEVLTLFKQGGTELIAVWYAFAAAPIFLIVAALLLKQVLKNESEFLISAATTFGILAGAMQVLGLIRWVFVVPVLANAYTDELASEATKAAAVLVFEGFHQYAGVAIGEHLGQLFTAVWILLTSIALLNSAVFNRWQGVVGMMIAAVMLLGLADGFATVIDFNAKIFSTLTMMSFIALSLWLIALGTSLVWHKSPRVLAATEVIYEG